MWPRPAGPSILHTVTMVTWHLWGATYLAAGRREIIKPSTTLCWSYTCQFTVHSTGCGFHFPRFMTWQCYLSVGLVKSWGDLMSSCHDVRCCGVSCHSTLVSVPWHIVQTQHALPRSYIQIIIVADEVLYTIVKEKSSTLTTDTFKNNHKPLSLRYHAVKTDRTTLKRYIASQ